VSRRPAAEPAAGFRLVGRVRRVLSAGAELVSPAWPVPEWVRVRGRVQPLLRLLPLQRQQWQPWRWARRSPYRICLT